MKVFVVTGHTGANISKIWSLCENCGIAPARVTENERDPSLLHDKLFRAYGIHLPNDPEQIYPGPLWRRLVENLFIDNIEQSSWGWGDARSSRLLEFLVEIDPGVHFILSYSSPVQILAEALMTRDLNNTIANSVLQTWKTKNMALLGFCSRHPERCCLVNAEKALQEPRSFVETMNKRFGIIPKENNANIAGYKKESCDLFEYLVSHLMDCSEVRNVCKELDVVADLPEQDLDSPINITSALGRYRELIELQASFFDLKSKYTDTEDRLEQIQNENFRLLKIESEMDSLFLQHNEFVQKFKENQAMISAGSERLANLERKIEIYRTKALFYKRSREKHCLRSSELQKQLNNATIAYESLAARYKKHKARFDILLAHGNGLRQKLNDYHMDLTEAQRKMEELHSMVESSVAERDQAAVHSADLQKQLVHLSQALEEVKKQSFERKTTVDNMTMENNKLKQILSEHQVELESAKKTYDAALRQTKMQENEIELLLLQLHQIQAELQKYHQKDSIDATKTEGNVSECHIKNDSCLAIEKNQAPEKQKQGFLRTYCAKKKARNRVHRESEIIRQSGLFDQEWYLNEYPDVQQAKMNPIKHYIMFGSKENRNPSPNFNTSYYLKQNSDVADAKMNPLLHYIQYGKDEGRAPAAYHAMRNIRSRK